MGQGIRLHKVLWILVAGGALASVLTLSASFGVGGALLFSNSGYDYGPAVIQEGNTIRVWWCGHGSVSGFPNGTDVIFHRSLNQSTGTWSSISQVFSPTPGQWDGQMVCDPTVVRGAFVNPADQLSYTYALYYTGTHDLDGFNNRVGAAFSNDGITWIRAGAAVVTPQQPAQTTYGAGQPSAYNGNGAAGIWLFHTDNSTTVGTRTWVRYAADGVTFGGPQLISAQGLPFLPSPPYMSNADFALDSSSGMWYMLANGTGRPSDREGYRITLARIHGSNIFTGSWEALAEINSNLTGGYLNHTAGLRRDGYGNLTNWLPEIGVVYASGGNDPIYWDLGYSLWNQTGALAPLRRYLNPANWDHQVTTGFVVQGSNLEGTLGYLFWGPKPGTQSLFGCLSGADFFVSLDEQCEGAGSIPLGTNGWLYSSPQTNTHALYRCRVGTERFVSADPACEGFTTDLLLGYARSAP